MNEVKCILCHEMPAETMTEGKACKTCGMILEDESREFCSKVCRHMYQKLTIVM